MRVPRRSRDPQRPRVGPASERGELPVQRGQREGLTRGRGRPVRAAPSEWPRIEVDQIQATGQGPIRKSMPRSTSQSQIQAHQQGRRRRTGPPCSMHSPYPPRAFQARGAGTTRSGRPADRRMRLCRQWHIRQQCLLVALAVPLLGRVGWPLSPRLSAPQPWAHASAERRA